MAQKRRKGANLFRPLPPMDDGFVLSDQNRSWVSCWAKLRSYQKTLSGPGRPLATVVFLRRRGRLCGCELEQSSQRAANPPRENGVPGHNPPVSKAQSSCLAATRWVKSLPFAGTQRSENGPDQSSWAPDGVVYKGTRKTPSDQKQQPNKQSEPGSHKPCGPG